MVKPKKEFVKSQVLVYLKDDKEPSSRLRPTKIFVHSTTKGVIVRDGRPVQKEKGKWVCRAR
jgi:hypothetical protein